MHIASFFRTRMIYTKNDLNSYGNADCGGMYMFYEPNFIPWYDLTYYSSEMSIYA